MSAELVVQPEPQQSPPQCLGCGGPPTAVYEFRVGPWQTLVLVEICLRCAMHCRPTTEESC